MKRLDIIPHGLPAGLLGIMLLCFPVCLHGEDEPSKSTMPDGIYMKLTKDFYEALRGDGRSGIKSYANDPTIEYLRQITISSKFMVETNLQILKQQEKIIQLLEFRYK
ncbi:MAG: hypothetical protein JW932_03920 [Deltaproteobacteria bacterium]|nr:hypothetical protein [Deltaproteobacteria bacterium]